MVASQAFGFPVEIVAKLLVLGAVVVTIIWVARIVARSTSSAWLAPVVGAALAVALLGAPGVDYGQREHLLVIFTMPYVAVLWERISGYQVDRRVALAAGVIGGIGFALKPHFVLIWVVLEIWRLSRRQAGTRFLFRPETLAVAAVGTLYALAVVLFHREYFGLLWEARELYGQFNAQPRRELLFSPYLVPLVAGLYLLRRNRSPVLELARCFLVFSWTAFAIMIVQGKGWSYHLYPVLASTIVFSVIAAPQILLSEGWSGAPRKLARAVALGLLAAGVLTVARTAVDRHVDERERRVAELSTRKAYFRDASPGTAVLLLTDRLEEGFPLVTLAELEWASAFSHLWWIKALYQHPAGASVETNALDEMGGLERDYFNALVRRVGSVEPEYVLVDTVPRSFYGGTAFPYVRYLNQHPAFRGQWRHYARRGSLDGFAVWRREVR